ncbi:MAG: response regulator [Chloroflexi bacterium]|nr:response regulator [Chloroflexota bacterium]
MDRQQVIEELKNSLGHLNDVALLADSALAQLLPTPVMGGEAASRGMQLRNLLVELIDALKPAPDVAEGAPEWRQYMILHDRYVLRKPLWEIEHKLTIGERQVRREHSRGLAILAEMLQARLAAHESPTAEPAATPQEAIQRLTPVSRVFGLAQMVEEVIAFLAVAGRIQEAQVLAYITPDDLTVCTDPGILRQLLTRLLLLLSPRLGQGECVTLAASVEGDVVKIVLSAGVASIDSEEEGLRLCQLLARTLGLHFQLQVDTAPSIAGAHHICFDLPSGSRLRRVLVIDDEIAAVELFQSYVIGLDYQVIGETNAEEAITRALEVEPDAIVLDVMMPAMDGWELLQRLHHTPQVRDVPVIVCSVLDEADLASALGAAAFLKKPILRSQLVKTLNQVIG